MENVSKYIYNILIINNNKSFFIYPTCIKSKQELNLFIEHLVKVIDNFEDKEYPHILPIYPSCGVKCMIFVTIYLDKFPKKYINKYNIKALILLFTIISLKIIQDEPFSYCNLFGIDKCELNDLERKICKILYYRFHVYDKQYNERFKFFFGN